MENLKSLDSGQHTAVVDRSWSHVLPTWPVSSRSPFTPINRQLAKADGMGVDSVKTRL